MTYPRLGGSSCSTIYFPKQSPGVQIAELISVHEGQRRNTRINLKNIGNGMMIASFVLLVATSGQYRPVPGWFVPTLFVGGFVAVVSNGVLDRTNKLAKRNYNKDGSRKW